MKKQKLVITRALAMTMVLCTGASTTVYANPVQSFTAIEQKAQDILIKEAAGSLESAYVTWNPVEGASGYSVYYKGLTDSTYTKLDNELIRKYPSYWRADALGLKSGSYIMKIVPIFDGVESNAIALTETLDVTAHTREGFAFSQQSTYKTGSGGYNDDGTIPDDAQIVYISASNFNTVTLDVITDSKGKKQTATGVVDILAKRQKGYDKTHLIFRLIGTIKDSDIAGLNGSGYVQFKGCYNVTLEGVGEDATIYGWGLLLRDAKNVEIRNLGVMLFKDDGISLDTNNENIWVHNNDIFYGSAGSDADQVKGDGSLDVKAYSNYVTLSYNHFYDSGKMSLCGMSDTKEFFVSYHHNWFDHSDSRHPRIRVGSVHIYNNYYDGNAKYGVGVTKGSSAFVEANVFRNCKYPMLSSLQGNDIAGGNAPTFSGEAGGMIKAFNNSVTGAKGLIYAPDNATDFDAYLASERKEQVPDTYKTISGQTTYNNFDTDSSMYSYHPDDPSMVVDKVTTYAGRVHGGDFHWAFNNEVDDADYSVNKPLMAAIRAYQSDLVSIGGVAGETTETPTPETTATPAPGTSATPTVAPTTAPTTTPSQDGAESKLWSDAGIFKGTVFGDVGGTSSLTTANFTLQGLENGDISIIAANNKGKIASGSDGFAMYYYKVPVGSTFTLTADAKVNSYSQDNQVSFGLMARDDLYIDQYITTTMGDYIAAGPLYLKTAGGVYNTFYRQDEKLSKGGICENAITAGSTIPMKIEGTADGYTATLGSETPVTNTELSLNKINKDYVYVGMYATRNANITFSNVKLVVDGQEVTGSVDVVPTEVPTQAPTETPTQAPVVTPSAVPTVAPTEVPTEAPTTTPTVAPTVAPTKAPVQQSPAAKQNVSSCNVSSIHDQTYTGSAVSPVVTVKNGSAALTKGVDYTVTYKNNTNAGTASVIITGINNYTGTKTVTFKIAKASIKKAAISSISNKTYTGKAIKPSITAAYNKKALTVNKDFTVSYKNNKAIGTATVTITGKGNFTGTKTATFKIVPAKTVLTGLKSKKSKTVTVSYKKVAGATGYEVAYATKANGTYKAVRTTKVKTTITKVKKNQKLYVKVRAYKVVNGKKVYGAYSTVQKVKVK